MKRYKTPLSAILMSLMVFSCHHSNSNSNTNPDSSVIGEPGKAPMGDVAPILVTSINYSTDGIQTIVDFPHFTRQFLIQNNTLPQTWQVKHRLYASDAF